MLAFASVLVNISFLMMIIHCPTQVPSPLCLLKSASWPFSAPTKRCFKRVSYFRKLPCDNNNLTFKYLPCQQTKSAILWTIEFTNAYIYINKKDEEMPMMDRKGHICCSDLCKTKRLNKSSKSKYSGWGIASAFCRSWHLRVQAYRVAKPNESWRGDVKQEPVW